MCLKYGGYVFNKFNMMVLLLVIAFCTSFSQNIRDIIQPVKLSGTSPAIVNVADLFWANDYNIQVLPNTYIKGTFTLEDSLLKIETIKDFEGLTGLDFIYKDSLYVIPVVVKKERYYKFSFKPLKKYDRITVIGQFNSWDRGFTPMNDTDGDGVYELEVAIEPGRYEYKFYADTEEIIDPENPVKVPNGMGDFNSVLIIDNPFSEKVFLHLLKSEPAKNGYFIELFLENSDASYELKKEDLFALFNNIPVPVFYYSNEGNKIQMFLPEDHLNGQNLVRIGATINGQVSNIQNILIENGKNAGKSGFRWYDAIIYSIMIDRFNDGDKDLNNPVKNDSLFAKANYMGGDFQGIIDKIKSGYFKVLGINTIWLSPVYDNPQTAFREFPAPYYWYTGYHGYWPVSHTNTEEKFGDIEKLKELVNVAKENGIQILLDFVSAHVHQEHPLFQKHPDWFGDINLPDGRLNLRLWDEYRLTTWFEPYLPKFDYLSAPDAIKYMTENAIYWMEQTGAAGFRHDAVKHVPNEFWRYLTSELKKYSIERSLPVYQIGETFGGYDLISSYVNNGQLDAQFNFNLYDVAVPVFIDSTLPFTLLANEIQKTFDVYGNLHLMGNLLDSHDKIRYMAYADGALEINDGKAGEIGWKNPPKVKNPVSYKKTAAHYAYILTIPGVPVIYYGSEFGMTGASDPDNRRMMLFGDMLNENEKEMFADVSKLIHLRAKNTALRYGDFYTVHADKDTWGYVRSDGFQRILTFINKSGSEKTVEFQLPEVYKITKSKNLINNTEFKISGKVTIVMKPYSYQILELFQ